MEHFFALADLERVHGITWGDLTEREPELVRLLWRARREGAGCRCRSDVDRVFSPLRNELADLVGFLGANRDDPILGSVGAYEVASRKVYDAVASLVRSPGVSALKMSA